MSTRRPIRSLIAPALFIGGAPVGLVGGGLLFKLGMDPWTAMAVAFAVGVVGAIQVLRRI